MDYKLYLSDAQITKMKNCYKKKEKCILRINLKNKPNKVLKLSTVQISNLETSKNQKKHSCDIELNLNQLGGILPFLIPAAIAAAKALGLGATGFLGTKLAQKVIGKGIKLPGKRY